MFPVDHCCNHNPPGLYIVFKNLLKRFLKGISSREREAQRNSAHFLLFHMAPPYLHESLWPLHGHNGSFHIHFKHETTVRKTFPSKLIALKGMFQLLTMSEPLLICEAKMSSRLQRERKAESSQPHIGLSGSLTLRGGGR